MSDNATDLLLYGVAAAQSNDREEARFYLEWALRTDADVDQETEAWYWLSRVTDDPAEKRNCLENVLAAYPKHPEARRDLAILEGRLKQENMVDLRRPLAPVTPSPTLQADDIGRFSCPDCGGKMIAQPGKPGLFCQFCGYRQASQQTGAGNGAVQEQDWVTTIYTERGHRWELPTERTLTCQGCGATVTLLPTQVSTECPFCGTPQVVIKVESRELIQPGGVIPFEFDASAVFGHARRFLEERRFRPSDLDGQSTVIPPRPVYVPFWTFNVSGEITWSGFTVDREFRQSRLIPTGGVLGAFYDEVLVPATKSLPAEHLSALRFDTNALVPYSTDLLADWPAEIYSVSMSDAAVLAHAQAHKKSEAIVQQDVELGMAGTVQNAKVEKTDLSVDSYKLALLPIWITGYTYKGQQYQLLNQRPNGAGARQRPAQQLPANTG